MTAHFLGIDLGTGGCKAALINDQGDVLGYTFREYPILNEKPGWSEHDPYLYWSDVCEMLQQILESTQISPTDIYGIGVSSALPAMVMLDHDGNPIHNAYNLMDRRAIREVEWVKENIGEDRLYKLT